MEQNKQEPGGSFYSHTTRAISGDDSKTPTRSSEPDGLAVKGLWLGPGGPFGVLVIETVKTEYSSKTKFQHLNTKLFTKTTLVYIVIMYNLQVFHY